MGLKAVTFLALLLWQAGAQAESILVSNHSLTNRGSARNIAMGGASIALPQNHSAVFESPGAIVFQGAFVEAGYLIGTIRDNVPVINGASTSGRKYSEGGASLLPMEFAGVGAGFRSESNSYTRALSSTTQQTIAVEQTEVPISLGCRLFDQFGVGASYVRLSSELKRDKLTGEIGTSLSKARYTGYTYQMSSLFAVNSNFALSAAYRAEADAEQSEPRPSAESVKFYHPGSVRLGLAYYIPPPEQGGFGPFLENTFSLEVHIVQFDNVTGAQKLYVPAATISENSSEVIQVRESSVPNDSYQYQTATRYIPKAGVETSLFTSEDFTALAWLGTYLEPELGKFDTSRTHMTGGVQLSAWFIVASAGIDMARDYTNQSYGLGTSFRY